MLAIKQLFSIKGLFKILTLENLNTSQRRKDDADVIQIWFKYKTLRLP